MNVSDLRRDNNASYYFFNISRPFVFRNNFFINDYVGFFCTRPEGRGGVGGLQIFVKDSWLVCRLNFSFSHSVYLALNAKHGCCSWYILGDFLYVLKIDLNDLQFERQLCIFGDLSIDTSLLEKICVSFYLNLLAKFGIECLIGAPTMEQILSGRIV